MKIVKASNGQKTVKMNKFDWERIGRKAGWIKKAQDQDIARTILSQLGGNKFVAMTGAKSFGNTGNGLSFRLPGSRGFTKNGINYVKITLNDLDTYNMEFGRIRGTNYKVIDTQNNIYFDMLTDVFTDVTGLNTSL